ncbi:hypothetical protein BB561_000965 [Smittium simulii]|uniref:Uncharacterized protein n=1 Tax=Smittium simulii TaxID=133385 RepID=A0A2T9YWR3_9FUNG|nr:hypothetical protein BB561_000965 [Smittium simulii]
MSSKKKSPLPKRLKNLYKQRSPVSSNSSFFSKLKNKFAASTEHNPSSSSQILPTNVYHSTDNHNLYLNQPSSSNTNVPPPVPQKSYSKPSVNKRTSVLSNISDFDTELQTTLQKSSLSNSVNINQKSSNNSQKSLDSTAGNNISSPDIKIPSKKKLRISAIISSDLLLNQYPIFEDSNLNKHLSLDPLPSRTTNTKNLKNTSSPTFTTDVDRAFIHLNSDLKSTLIESISFDHNPSDTFTTNQPLSFNFCDNLSQPPTCQKKHILPIIDDTNLSSFPSSQFYNDSSKHSNSPILNLTPLSDISSSDSFSSFTSTFPSRKNSALSAYLSKSFSLKNDICKSSSLYLQSNSAFFLKKEIQSSSRQSISPGISLPFVSSLKASISKFNLFLDQPKNISTQYNQDYKSSALSTCISELNYIKNPSIISSNAFLGNGAYQNCAIDALCYQSEPDSHKNAFIRYKKKNYKSSTNRKLKNYLISNRCSSHYLGENDAVFDSKFNNKKSIHSFDFNTHGNNPDFKYNYKFTQTKFPNSCDLESLMLFSKSTPDYHLKPANSLSYYQLLDAKSTKNNHNFTEKFGIGSFNNNNSYILPNSNPTKLRDTSISTLNKKYSINGGYLFSNKLLLEKKLSSINQNKDFDRLNYNSSTTDTEYNSQATNKPGIVYHYEKLRKSSTDSPFSNCNTNPYKISMDSSCTEQFINPIKPSIDSSFTGQFDHPNKLSIDSSFTSQFENSSILTNEITGSKLSLFISDISYQNRIDKIRFTSIKNSALYFNLFENLYSKKVPIGVWIDKTLFQHRYDCEIQLDKPKFSETLFLPNENPDSKLNSILSSTSKFFSSNDLNFDLKDKLEVQIPKNFGKTNKSRQKKQISPQVYEDTFTRKNLDLSSPTIKLESDSGISTFISHENPPSNQHKNKSKHKSKLHSATDLHLDSSNAHLKKVENTPKFNYLKRKVPLINRSNTHATKSPSNNSLNQVGKNEPFKADEINYSNKKRNSINLSRNGTFKKLQGSIKNINIPVDNLIQSNTKQKSISNSSSCSFDENGKTDEIKASSSPNICRSYLDIHKTGHSGKFNKKSISKNILSSTEKQSATDNWPLLLKERLMGNLCELNFYQESEKINENGELIETPSIELPPLNFSYLKIYDYNNDIEMIFPKLGDIIETKVDLGEALQKHILRHKRLSNYQKFLGKLYSSHQQKHISINGYLVKDKRGSSYFRIPNQVDVDQLSSIQIDKLTKMGYLEDIKPTSSPITASVEDLEHKLQHFLHIGKHKH